MRVTGPTFASGALVRVVGPTFVAGFVVNRDVVVESAPILRRMGVYPGRRLAWVVAWAERRRFMATSAANV